MASSKKNPLRWRPYQIARGRAAGMRPLTRDVVPEFAGAAEARAAIELPDLTDYPTAREKAVRLLGAAAAIEHALMI